MVTFLEMFAGSGEEGSGDDEEADDGGEILGHDIVHHTHGKLEGDDVAQMVDQPMEHLQQRHVLSFVA